MLEILDGHLLEKFIWDAMVVKQAKSNVLAMSFTAKRRSIGWNNTVQKQLLTH